MELEEKNGKMEHGSKVNLCMESSKAQESFTGQMVALMLELIIRMKCTLVLIYGDFTDGLTIELTKANGRKARCMELELLHGQMAENTKANTLTTLKKAQVHLLGQVENSISVVGNKVFNMA